jgi:hypothetical protein
MEEEGKKTRKKEGKGLDDIYIHFSYYFPDQSFSHFWSTYARIFLEDMI